jgi:hypothetical protein
VDLVFHFQFTEIKWIEWLLRDAVDRIHYDVQFSRPIGDAIHVFGLRDCDAAAIRDYIPKCRDLGGQISLFQIGDEYFTSRVDLYDLFDRVIRNHRNSFVAAPGVLSILLGLPNAEPVSRSFAPASGRSFVWSFAGQIKTSRIAMAEALAPIVPNRLVDTMRPGTVALEAAGYAALLDDTVFIPCPMGNAHLETWRVYEALERGCIPVLEARLTLDYYRALLGPHPLPTFASWREAGRAMARLAADPQALDDLQAEVARWWAGAKDKLRADVHAHLGGPSRRRELTAFAKRLRVRNPALRKASGMVEILRHQTLASIRQRLTAGR